MNEILNRRSALASGLKIGAIGALAASGIVSTTLQPDNPGTDRREIALRAMATPTLGFACGSTLAGLSSQVLSQRLNLFTATRVGGLRFDIPWFHVEARKNTFAWAATDAVVNSARSRGAYLLATIGTCPAWAAANGSGYQWTRPRNPTEFATFCGSVAQRYKGKVDAYEIWNEPNGALFFSPTPDAAFYTSMVRAAYASIKAVDPSATVLAGALASTSNSSSTVSGLDFLTAMYQNSLAGSCDAVSNHPYEWNFRSTFADGMRYDTSPIRQMINMRKLMISHGDAGKKIWLTEFGAPTVGAVTQDMQNQLIVNCVRQWQGLPYSGPMFIHTLRDASTGSSDPEDNFGVATSALAPKLALYGIEALGRVGYPTSDANAVFFAHADPSLGGALGPAYPLGSGWAMDCENGSRFLTNWGFLNSPPAVATVARQNGVVPKTAFANGMQDMDYAAPFRVFSRSDVGTHAVYAALLTAWSADMGFPLTDHYTPPGTNNVACDFEHGRITWSPTTGTTVERSNQRVS